MDGLANFNPGTMLASQAALGGMVQCTLKAAIDCIGIGLHSGARVAMTLRPAPANHGIVFRRRDLGVDIPARFDLVVDTKLCTVLAHPTIANATVATVEHVMAALAGTGISNAIVEVDGPELPILDGSASNIVFLIDCVGIIEQQAARSCLEILRPVRVESADGGFAELVPASLGAAMGLAANVSIAFGAAAIGAQSIAVQITPDSFRSELASARTFAQLGDIAALKEAGLARGGSLDNAVVVDGARVLNPGGLRMADEFVRHKLLDVVGDIALAGAPLHATLRAHRPGHALNNLLLRKVFSDAANWRVVPPNGGFSVASRSANQAGAALALHGWQPRGTRAAAAPV